MKPLFKNTLLMISIATLLNTSIVMAKTATSQNTTATSNQKFKDENQQVAYALGASIGRYIDNSLQQQNELGINLDKKILLQGFQDVLADKGKLSDEEISKTLEAFTIQVKEAEKKQIAKIAGENGAKGKAFRDDFAKKPGVKKTASGLLYRVELAGSGSAPKDDDTVVVNYKGTLIDGKEFDNSYQRNEPLSFRVDRTIQGWIEGLKYIRKGGKIELVIPPDLAYGETGRPGIPPNSTLMFQVELLDIKPLNAKEASDTPDTEQTPANNDKK